MSSMTKLENMIWEEVGAGMRIQNKLAPSAEESQCYVQKASYRADTDLGYRQKKE